MLNEPSTNNLKLTPEQLAHLDTLTNRSDSLKASIVIHQNNIVALQNTNAQLEKDRDNLTKTIEEKKPILAKLESDITNLQVKIESGNKDVETACQEADNLRNVHNAVQLDLTQQAKDLAILQIQIQEDGESISKSKSAIEKENAELARKKSILEEALKSL